MKNKELIIEYCKNLGLDTVGFTECRVFNELKPLFENRKKNNVENEFEEQDIEKRINPFLYMTEGKTIISIAFPYFFKDLNKGEIFFSSYTLGSDYHKVAFEYLNGISKYIEDLGGKAACFVDSNSLPERYLAYLCGLGFIGKNNMLITKQYGSYVFLGEIITDLELITEEEKETIVKEKVNKIDKYGDCKDCDLCIKSCPTKSIKLKSDLKNSYNNPNVCLSYITQKKHIEDKWFNLIEGRLFGCDSCQDMCPYNHNISESRIEAFTPKEYMKEIYLEELTTLSNEAFKEKYSSTSCGWRGKNLLTRNALIACFNKGYKINLKEIKSPYVKEYYGRLFTHKDL